MATEDSRHKCKRCGDPVTWSEEALLCPRCTMAVRSAVRSLRAGKCKNRSALDYARYLSVKPAGVRSNAADETEAFDKLWQLRKVKKGTKFCLGCGAWMKLATPGDYCPACEERRQRRRAKNG